MAVIGVDLDGTCMEYMQRFTVWHNQEYRTSVTYDKLTSYEHTHRVFGISETTLWDRFGEFNEQGQFALVEPISGSVEILTSLSQIEKSDSKPKHRLEVVTRRSEQYSAKAQRRVDEVFPGVFRAFHCTHLLDGTKRSKLEICVERGVDLLFEDSPDYALECAGAGIVVLQKVQPWNRHLQAEGHQLIAPFGTWTRGVEDSYLTPAQCQNLPTAEELLISLSYL